MKVLVPSMVQACAWWYFFRAAPCAASTAQPGYLGTGSGNLMTVEEILKQYESSRHFYRGGGITATGGEPLMQLDFLTQLFEAARKKDIHTCLDTSGVTITEAMKNI